MNESIVPISPGLLAILSGVETGLSPFKQEIFLLEIIVAGTTYCKDLDTVEDDIVPEKVLVMKREPHNKYDKYAIAIYCDKVRIGFVPADMNLVCSRLMDAGKMFFCRVVSKEWLNNWMKIKANIYMVE
jgi:hypothetical protein